MALYGGGDRGGLVSRAALQRIQKAVVAYERGVNIKPQRFRQAGDDGDAVRLGKTTAAWNKGTVATIELYEQGTPPDETRNDEPYELADCINKFASVGSGKWVMVAQAGNGRWYLIAAECD